MPALSSLSAGACAPPPQRGPALVLDRVSRRHGATTAVDDVSLAVAAGRVAALVGPNGCGKTTTLSLAAGLLRPHAGRVAVCGLAQPARAAAACTALVPDEPRGLDELTVAEYVALVGSLHRSGPAFAGRARTVLASFGLDRRTHAPLRSLSHGLRRQAALAAALALAPPLLLVDEATAGLDPEAVIVLRAAVRAVAAGGSAVLLATQDLHFAESACDDVFLLARGRLVVGGPVPELVGARGAPSLEALFVRALERDLRLDDLDGCLAAR